MIILDVCRFVDGCIIPDEGIPRLGYDKYVSKADTEVECAQKVKEDKEHSNATGVTYITSKKDCWAEYGHILNDDARCRSCFLRENKERKQHST